MAINYTILAQVIDISKDVPQKTDVFLVDTHVWYWMTYTRASLRTTPPAQHQITYYPAYMKAALNAGSEIFQSHLSLAELAHQIEKAEQEIYEKTAGGIKPKEYRHNLSSERSRVVSEIRTAWSQVTSLAKPLVVAIDTPMANSALARLQIEKVDGYDLFILESMKNHKVMQIITDDGDFCSVKGIQVFTANLNVIQAARRQGKLVIRK